MAPTNNFVDFATIISAAESSVKSDLGGALPDSQLSKALGRELSIVLADGQPNLVVRRAVKPLGNSAYDIRSAVDTTFGTFKLVSSCAAGQLKKPDDQVATQPESDLLAGLGIAADQLTAVGAHKTIYVLGNGIQTAGAITMQKAGQFPKSPKYAQTLALGLRDIGALPDLHGARVVWYGLGQVDGTFQQLSQKPRDSLVSFWQQVIAMSNGVLSTSDIYGQVGSGVPASQAITVTSTKVQTCGLVVKLYESDGVKFQPDSASFVDSNLAKSAAKRVVASFKAAHCDELTVTGYAAAGMDLGQYKNARLKVDAANKTLTNRRAQAFAKLLSSAGFAGDITTTGAGTCGTEWATSGHADPVLQGLCRRVEVKN